MQSNQEAAILGRYSQSPDHIVAVLEQMGAENIRLMGDSIRCTCPIHHGQDPNFAVWYHNGTVVWKCYSHGCGQGPLTTLPMARYDFSRQQSVSWLAHKVGLKVDGETVQVSEEEIERAWWAAFNRKYGLDKPLKAVEMPESMVRQSLQTPCDYFLRRGFEPRTLQRYQVGFIPANTWMKRKEDGKMTGWFDDRVSIPIRTWDNKLLGFSGRRIDDDVRYQKYKILAGTLKSETLYGIHLPETQEAIRQTKTVIIMEGFADVWRAWQHNIHNAVSFMGTSPSDNQINLLGRSMVKTAIFFFDGDEAGKEAVKRYSSSIASKMDVAIATPPDGKDPGDLVNKDEFLRCLDSAQAFAD